METLDRPPPEFRAQQPAARASAGDARMPGWLLLVMLGAIFALSTGDRAVLPVLKTTLMGDLGLTNRGYAALVVTFMATYTGMYFLVGAVVHRLGVQRTLTACILLLSGSAALSGTARDIAQLAAALVVLGVAQACVIPAITVVIFRTFPPQRQAFAYAVVNGFQSLAAILCPAFVAIVTLQLGWRWTFATPAFAGVLIAVGWRQMTARADSALAPSIGSPGSLAAWRELFSSRAVLVLILARVISDPFWFFFQFWQAAFLQERIGMSLADVGRLAWISPAAATAGVFGLGLFSDRLIARGGSVIPARVGPMLGVSALAVGAFLLPSARSAPVAVFLCALTSVMCGTWLSLSAILMGSLAPRHAQATALGVMSAIGGLSAIGFNALAGLAIDRFGYEWPLRLGALLHPIAALVLVRCFIRPCETPSTTIGAHAT